jgi:hypothetical protein
MLNLTKSRLRIRDRVNLSLVSKFPGSHTGSLGRPKATLGGARSLHFFHSPLFLEFKQQSFTLGTSFKGKASFFPRKEESGDYPLGVRWVSYRFGEENLVTPVMEVPALDITRARISRYRLRCGAENFSIAYRSIVLGITAP